MSAAHSLVLNYSDSVIAESRLEEDRWRVWNGEVRSVHAMLARRGICPFCDGPLRHAYYGRAYYDYETPTGDNRVCVDVLECRCGWWDMDAITTPDWSEYESDTRYERRSGLLRTFDPKALDLPLDVLRTAVSNDPSVVDYIHSSSFERYVGALLSDHIFHCEVRHCGRSGDGGVDLFAIDCDEPVVIQVKRRQNLHQSEGVAAVREFVGAMVAGRHMRGMFVTTRQFSQSAKAYAATIVDNGAVEEFTLVDGDMLVALFGLELDRAKPAWFRYLPPPVKVKYADGST